MRHVCSIAASTAVLCMAGYASPTHITVSEPVGPAPTEQARARGGSTLEVYSARVRAPVDVYREEFLWNNDFGRNAFLYEPAHSDYTICDRDGKVLQHVRNARNPEDPEPAVVPLAPGEYEVKAKARDFGLVTIPVVIEAGKLTVVNLQREKNPAVAAVAGTHAVVLGGYEVVGWRANGSGLRDRQ
jgi:hypothetical protein